VTAGTTSPTAQAAPANAAGTTTQSTSPVQQTGTQQPNGAAAACSNSAGPQALAYGTEFPPAAKAAVQHIAALQGVLQEALGLIRCWQQQKVIIALLQQRLQELTGRARSTQRHVSVARRELQQLQVERDQSVTEAATLSQRCGQLAEQLQKAQQDLGSAASDQQSLQQRLEEALAELASSKEALAKLQVCMTQAIGSAASTSGHVQCRFRHHACGIVHRNHLLKAPKPPNHKRTFTVLPTTVILLVNSAAAAASKSRRLRLVLVQQLQHRRPLTCQLLTSNCRTQYSSFKPSCRQHRPQQQAMRNAVGS
jgi:hypothetical protein